MRQGLETTVIFMFISGTMSKAGTWVPLDEYYYGKKEGDPSYREEKGEYRFKVQLVTF